MKMGSDSRMHCNKFTRSRVRAEVCLPFTISCLKTSEANPSVAVLRKILVVSTQGSFRVEAAGSFENSRQQVEDSFVLSHNPGRSVQHMARGLPQNLTLGPCRFCVRCLCYMLSGPWTDRFG